MVDITHKNTTKRTAIASATVSVSKQETINAIKNRAVPKGDVLEMAKTAGLFAVKRTYDVIPDCHPLPVEYTSVDYDIDGLDIHIQITVKTVYKTGVEVEAMHGASVIALTMYDMLKPIDKKIEIKNIRLVEKQGGKSDLKERFSEPITACIIVCSDSIYHGKKRDIVGQIVQDKLYSHSVKVTKYEVIPDNVDLIEDEVLQSQQKGNDLILVVGGTGLSRTDKTPEVLDSLIERRIPGMEEAIRQYGQQRTPYAMFSRSIVGTMKNSLVLGIPGSTNGASESMDAIFPAALHVFKNLKR